MTISVTIKSRKFKETMHFVTSPSGYVYLNPTPTSWGQQVFDKHGNAEIALTEDDLRRVARRYIARMVAIDV